MIGKFSVSRVLPAGLVLALLVAPSAVAAESAPTLQIPLLEQAAMQTAKGQRSVLLAVTRAGARLVAVGERGIILLSDDSGTSWRQARVPVSVSLTAVQFIDAEHGWAVGHLGVVLHTADGGETWVKQLDGVRAAQLALASARSSGDAKRMKEAEWLVADGPDKPFLDLHFSDRQNGYVVGAYNLILHTADGGESWQPWMGHVENPEGLNLYSIRAAAGLLFIAGERGLLLRSVDNGQSFQALNAPYDGSFFGLLASATGELVAYGLRGNAYWSGDQGDSWRRIETGVEVALSSGARLNDGSLLLASQSGELLISRDQGRSFRHVPDSAGATLAGLVVAPDGSLTRVGLSGLSRQTLDFSAVQR